ncbi:MAG: di-trans,poly-cis-decaprenylcistransferase [Planctomycetes bacterium]|nr:di-trans,poly-cis-decaprenylcistransferase [Planctomycetota bacterium]
MGSKPPETKGAALPPLDATKFPGHLAVIMDGNGRWAQAHGLPRIKGHEEGARSVREVTEECAALGLGRLTLYAFSSENWKRPKNEIDFLMKLLRRYLVNERRTILENNIRFTAIGRLEALGPAVLAEMEKTRELSRRNTGMVMCLALNYGGRQEIVDAAQRLAREVAEGKRAWSAVDEAALDGAMYDPAAPPPDLLIRTGGDQRISNFLLWHLAYTELWITQKAWPDFKRPELHEALRDYATRARRFGGL